MINVIDNRNTNKPQPEDLSIGDILVDCNEDQYLIALDKKEDVFIAIHIESMEVSYAEDFLDELFLSIEIDTKNKIKEIIKPEQYCIVIE